MLSAQNLRKEQKLGIQFIRDNPTSLLLADPGAGKTTVGLHWIKLMKPGRTLLVSTKLICLHVWEQEALNWKGTKHLTFTQLAGCSESVRKERIKEITDVHLINFEQLTWLIEYLKSNKRMRLRDLYEAIIFDESSFLKTPGSKRFKKIRNQVQEVPYRIGMTGTPLGNSMLNLWGQAFLCCGEDPLMGRYVSERYGPKKGFRETYFDSDYNGWKWNLKDNAFEKIVNRMIPYSYRIPVDPARKTKPINYIPIDYKIPKHLLDDYKQLRDDLFLNIDTDDGVFDVSGQAAVIQNKLRQMESGAMYVDEKNWVELHNEKLDRTEDLVRQLNGEPLLIFYEYEHEFIRLKERIPNIVHIKSKNSVDRWNNNEISVMVAHPKSSGHGLNLHKGGAYNMLYHTLPWSLEIWKQAKGRLDRTGQPNRVNLYSFTGPPVETKVSQLLKNLKSLEDRFMAAIEARKKLTYTA